MKHSFFLNLKEKERNHEKKMRRTPGSSERSFKLTRVLNIQCVVYTLLLV